MSYQNRGYRDHRIKPQRDQDRRNHDYRYAESRNSLQKRRKNPAQQKELQESICENTLQIFVNYMQGLHLIYQIIKKHRSPYN